MACNIGCADIIGEEEKQLKGCRKKPEWTQRRVGIDRKIGLIFIGKVPRRGHEQKKREHWR
jgi:hypothetical protein